MTSRRLTFCLCAATMLLTFPPPLLGADHTTGPPDIRAMAREADFIFKGTVREVKYRNSEFVQLLDPTGEPIYDENSQPVWADGSNMPHSFTTYEIAKIYKGKPPQVVGGPPSNLLTLQKVGGIDQTAPEDILFVPRHPHFDIGDTDILFVQRNTIRTCPLVRSAAGRFRLIADATRARMIFSDTGHEIVHVFQGSAQRDNIDLGPAHPDLPEVTKCHFGDCDGCTLERTRDTAESDEHGLDDPPLPGVPKGPQFGEGDFDIFLERVVAEEHTAAELRGLPPVVSADITMPFRARPFGEDAPIDTSQEPPHSNPRPWLDQLPEQEREAILEAERQEAMMFELAGGNPVLPSNECEMRILVEGAIPGDISGPEGKPDCYVNFFDVAVLGAAWLECNDPSDPTCF